jgi:hypothetical protein
MRKQRTSHRKWKIGILPIAAALVAMVLTSCVQPNSSNQPTDASAVATVPASVTSVDLEESVRLPPLDALSKNEIDDILTPTLSTTIHAQTSIPVPTATPVVRATALPTVTPEGLPTEMLPEVTPSPTVAAVGDHTVTGAVAAPATLEEVQPALTTEVATTVEAPAAALVQIPDTDPGPPFSVEISMNLATPNPLLDGSTLYKVTGLLRNDGEAVYAVNRVHITFFDAGGFRGSYNPFPQRRYGEYVWHGAMEAEFDCMLLAPGEACPFTAEIAAYDIASFLVHADAVVAQWREPAPVTVQSSTLIDQRSNVRITGVIVNPNTYAIKNVVVNAVLLDADGRIASMGSSFVVQGVAPGAEVAFTAMVPVKEAYVSYEFFVQAEGDFR